MSGFGYIGTRLAGYGEVLVPLGWVPLLGPWLSRAGALAVALGRRPKDPQLPTHDRFLEAAKRIADEHSCSSRVCLSAVTRER